ncbi:uncharacterized protein AFUA_2G09900 [Aspergillus fumigatus Af293]
MLVFMSFSSPVLSRRFRTSGTCVCYDSLVVDSKAFKRYGVLFPTDEALLLSGWVPVRSATNFQLSKSQGFKTRAKGEGAAQQSTMSLWSSYRSLTPKTRALFGVGLMAWASLGLWFSPQIENAMGMVPSAEEKEELERKLALRVSRVEKGN